jgi:leucyl aminopeptidase (aminopeptidase T)
MTYIHLQPKSGFAYDVTLHSSVSQMKLVRLIRLHRYEIASKRVSSTWIDDLSRTRTHQGPSWAGGSSAEDLLQDQHRRCIEDVEKLQAILDLEQG